jgi:hypothetical protein
MDDLQKLRQLAGITDQPILSTDSSMSGTEKSRIMKEKNIRPGTPQWFQLWFSKPQLTGESPYK